MRRCWRCISASRAAGSIGGRHTAAALITVRPGALLTVCGADRRGGARCIWTTIRGIWYTISASLAGLGSMGPLPTWPLIRMEALVLAILLLLLLVRSMRRWRRPARKRVEHRVYLVLREIVRSGSR